MKEQMQGGAAARSYFLRGGKLPVREIRSHPHTRGRRGARSDTSTGLQTRKGQGLQQTPWLDSAGCQTHERGLAPTVSVAPRNGVLRGPTSDSKRPGTEVGSSGGMSQE